MSFLQRSIGEDIFTHVHFRGYKDFKKSSFISVATIEGHATLCRTYELVVWLSTTPAGQKKRHFRQGGTINNNNKWIHFCSKYNRT